jgi:DhnA family fructose-bisphosphate aldolase class Ia
MTAGGPEASAGRGGLRVPALVLAADHRARGIVTVERYVDYVRIVSSCLAHADGLIASVQPLGDLAASDALAPAHQVYLSANRTGLYGTSYQMDDRLVVSLERAASLGVAGVKLMTRIDRDDPRTADALVLLGRVLEESASLGLDVMVEALAWSEGRFLRHPDDIVLAAVIAHDMGSPLLKVPVPDAPPGDARREAVARVVASVGAPVLFLGGPAGDERDDPARARQCVLEEVADVMAGGGAGMAMGRRLYLDPDPGEATRLVAGAVHAR